MYVVSWLDCNIFRTQLGVLGVYIYIEMIVSWLDCDTCRTRLGYWVLKYI